MEPATALPLNHPIEPGPPAVERDGRRHPGVRFLGLPLPAWLVALSVIPLLGGAARLLQLAGGGTPTPADLRFAQAPLPVTLHIVAATLYSLIGAFQFDLGLRVRRPRLHRILGRVAVASGAVLAVSGLWMAVASEIPAGLQGELLLGVRMAVAAGMAASLVLGITAIRAGRVRRHQAWMARAYALALGAATQALLLGPPTIAFGDITGPARDLAMTAAWLLNLAIVERVLATSGSSRTRPTAP